MGITLNIYRNYVHTKSLPQNMQKYENINKWFAYYIKYIQKLLYFSYSRRYSILIAMNNHNTFWATESVFS